MRSIKKLSLGGHHLTLAHSTPPLTSDAANKRWGRFKHKNDVKLSLIDEQYRLCCYSELRADQEGLGYHIEHVENKSQNPARIFDYSNLAASALDSAYDLHIFKGQADVVFGGHASGKQQAVDMTLFISCHQSDCSRFFSYLSDGRVVPSNKLDALDEKRAQYTIDLLNLNSPFLIVRRRQWWDEIDQLLQEHQSRDWSLPDLVSIELLPT